MPAPMFNFSNCQFNQHKEQEYYHPQKSDTPNRENSSSLSLQDMLVYLCIGMAVAVITGPRVIAYLPAPSNNTTIVNTR